MRRPHVTTGLSEEAKLGGAWCGRGPSGATDALRADGRCTALIRKVRLAAEGGYTVTWVRSQRPRCIRPRLDPGADSHLHPQALGDRVDEALGGGVVAH